MRCPWAEQSEIERNWHDLEWGRIVRDDRHLFELLTLKGAQAGLAWRTVLSKRDAYRERFHDFDIAAVAAMGDDELEQAMHDRGIIRHRLKVASVRANARIVMAMAANGESLSSLLWSFTGGKTIVNAYAMQAEVPMRSPISDAMSKELQRRGFRYAGTAICYSLMQSAGMVNDHLASCDCHGRALR
ncbi:DNA-3-methyladenine glycosylase I [Luteibacter aegosomaticola]|uniref:DNA-3-methyladenine glycosylase I n=1 Tax=Luteibacter aegosomaticola TaxID=2911538 RepID=UPI001FF812C4|nr:DNA-3-methyladenine glycosylase I [Luteibacter aegosomaticola]UPG89919.1 DNA-3-methyladenine glycosylase I [Luteibacter aegosomaticola]